MKKTLKDLAPNRQELINSDLKKTKKMLEDVHKRMENHLSDFYLDGSKEFNQVYLKIGVGVLNLWGLLVEMERLNNANSSEVENDV